MMMLRMMMMIGEARNAACRRHSHRRKRRPSHSFSRRLRDSRSNVSSDEALSLFEPTAAVSNLKICPLCDCMLDQSGSFPSEEDDDENYTNICFSRSDLLYISL
eukprot:TRINITY_DN4344_c0_g2_i1.p1 TRINITY_DN4344_c0_g2~~TRINITY_DN4344_c0_g2_i1.p1  ORF type:complete len:104 (-),score=3.27 TRINITY_DN4344_c0_g2_i1:56-367(-)